MAAFHFHQQKASSATMIDLKGYGHFSIERSTVTLSVALVSTVGTMVLGLLGARPASTHKVLRRIGAAYTTIIRGVPDLALLRAGVLWRHGAPEGIACWFGRVEPIDINAFITCALAASFIYGGLCHGSLPRRLSGGAQRADRGGQGLRHEPLALFPAHPIAAGLALCAAGSRQCLAVAAQGHRHHLGRRPRGIGAQGGYDDAQCEGAVYGLWSDDPDLPRADGAVRDCPEDGEKWASAGIQVGTKTSRAVPLAPSTIR